VLGGRAYVQQLRPAFQTRDPFTIWGVLQLLHRYPGRVPDIDLMFDTVDWPVVRAHLYRGKYAEMLAPLYRYCGDAGYCLPRLVILGMVMLLVCLFELHIFRLRGIN
jgi:hypothetical protein